MYEELVNRLRRYTMGCVAYKLDSDFAAAVQEAADVIEKPSAINDQKKIGEWIGEADGYSDGELVYDTWSCGCCGKYFPEWDEKPDWNFCPNCGADMRGDKDA